MTSFLSNELTGLQLIMLLQVAIGLPAEVFFRYRARARGERLDRRQEGIAMLVVLRTCLLARWVAVAAFVFNPSWLSWSSMSTAMELRWITATFEIASTSAMLWVFYTLGRNLTDTVLVRSRGQLVMAGPYRFVRHPLYTAFGCMALADPLVMDSWAVGLVDIAILGILVQRTRIEEAKLLERFGDSYREYSRRTPAFIPGWPVQACSVPPQES